MSRKTFYIIAAIWFVLVIIAVAASFLPIVDRATQAEVRRYLVFVVVIGALCLMLIRKRVK